MRESGIIEVWDICVLLPVCVISLRAVALSDLGTGSDHNESRMPWPPRRLLAA